MMTAPDLSLCGECGKTLCFPVAWRTRPNDEWWIRLRCPNCEHVREGTFGKRLVERLDDALDAGTATLVRELALLTRLNMAEEAELLHAAFQADALFADDFAPH